MIAERIAQDDDLVMASFIFVREEVAAQCGLHA
jgi:hypothetical protein